jgi:predicted RNA binding protein YcfA (HicA-like mRNA interferase family)
MKPVSGKRMCRLLESRGWYLLRVAGSHHVDRSDILNRQVSVPVHANKDLRAGTQHRIMRDAGMSDGDL